MARAWTDYNAGNGAQYTSAQRGQAKSEHADPEPHGDMLITPNSAPHGLITRRGDDSTAIGARGEAAHSVRVSHECDL